MSDNSYILNLIFFVHIFEGNPILKNGYHENKDTVKIILQLLSSYYPFRKKRTFFLESIATFAEMKLNFVNSIRPPFLEGIAIFHELN